jgi:hypothetical protein
MSAAFFLLVVGTSYAEEGGSGHYLPGSLASFMDGVSPTEAFIARVNVLHYEGKTSLDRALPIAGETAINAEAKSTAVGLTLFWRPEWGGSVSAGATP